MSNKKQLLPLDGCANLLKKLVGDFALMSKNGHAIPKKRTYKVLSSVEPYGIERSARKVAFLRLRSIGPGVPIRKLSFDARRTNQDNDRNPRNNLQYYNRSQQYIDEDDQRRLECFARLLKPLRSIKDKYGNHPEYFYSYARKLHNNVESMLKTGASNRVDLFRPQMDYLEQLLYARYRISIGDLEKISSEVLEEKVLAKDEDLLGRGSFVHIVDEPTNNNQKADVSMVKDGDKAGITQDSIINAIFGNNDLRRESEKAVERTITITIRDAVID